MSIPKNSPAEPAENKAGGEAFQEGSFTFVNEGAGQRLDKFLQFRLPGKSRSFVQDLIKKGLVMIGGSAAKKASQTLQHRETVSLTVPSPIPTITQSRFVPFTVLYEDDHIAVINKPAGYMVHPVEGGDETTLVHGLLWRFKELSWMAGDDRPGIVHRLDRDTSGVMLVAKHDTVHYKLTMKFKAREIHKQYVALCTMKEPVQGGLIDMPIGRSLRNRKKMAIQYETGRHAITEYKVDEMFGRYAVVHAYPRSGRTHQIRVHLSFMGLPILADKLYGREKSIYANTLKGRKPGRNEKPVLERQALHACTLELEHPETGLPLHFEAEMPPDMQQVVGLLRRIYS